MSIINKCPDDQALRYVKNIELVLSKRIQRDIYSHDSKWHRADMKHTERAEIKESIIQIADNCGEWAKKLSSEFYSWFADCNRDLGQWDEPVRKALSFDKPSDGPFTYYNATIAYLKSIVTFSKSELLSTLDSDDRHYLRELIIVAEKLRKTIMGIYNYCYEIETVHSDLVEGTKDGLKELYIGLEQLLRICVETISTGFVIRRKANNRRFATNYDTYSIIVSGGRTIETNKLIPMFRVLFWGGSKTKPEEYNLNKMYTVDTKIIIEFRKNINAIMRMMIGDRHPLYMSFNGLISTYVQALSTKKLDVQQIEYIENLFFDMWAIAIARTVISESEKEASN